MTVVVPTFNRRALVCEAVDSVLAQTERHFELLVVDDGSTDGTADELELRYADESRLHVLRKSNGGSASARNLAFDQARSPWIALLDSDDVWDPTYLASQLTFVEQHPDADAVVADLRLEGPWQRAGDSVFADPAWQPPTSMAAMMDGAWALPTATLLRASVARQLRYDEDYRSGEDTELLFRFHAAGHRLVVNRAVIGAWRRHALPGTDPQKTGAADSMSLEHELLLEMYRHPEPRSRDVRRRIARMHAKRMIRDRRWREARPYLWQWWRLRPGSTRALRLLVRSYVAGKARRPSWPAIRASAGSG
ncbi:MAG: glycosyltransferase family 2 protein [Planctomycetes bacterium]|nr:glycosyltransferase family 2 protein [Planctomycetota bacterium]MCB9830210.1 glycosyltransferase family 2 protein [Planctomycetota bacterium]MCB9902153.1 glycosyltransferase family 2 protein [Planctomycetota bacterium]